MKLKTYRAIKCILKTQSEPSSFLLEASLLKNLRHPGIPIIYDVEEDDTYFYLIEEYIQGESLYAYVQSYDNISQDTVISFGIQLCSVLEYLHNQKPMSILYLDLKPEHIILCGNQLKLIDYGISTLLIGSGNQCQNLGTKGFAAPEQYRNEALTVQTDIYGMGALLYYMLTKKILPHKQGISFIFPKNFSKNFRHIILKATAHNMEDRYENINQLRDMLQKELMYRTGHSQKMHLLKKIIITGSQGRIGVTHFAISLVSWLNRKGNSAFYEEKNHNEILGQLAQYKEGFCEQGGILRYQSFQAISGDSTIKTSVLSHHLGILVQDYGFDLDPVLQDEFPDMLILIAGGRAWETEAAIKAYEMLSGEENLIIICNYNHKQKARDYAKIFQKKVFCFPLDEDPFLVTREKDRLFAQIMKERGN